MTSLYANLVRGTNGAWSTAYGPFVLRTALQPVFRRLSGGILDIDAFQGLVRAERNEEPYPPSQFFPLIDAKDLPKTDSLLRAIHILNTGLLGRGHARLFVSFNPDLYPDPQKLRHEIEHMRLAGHEAGLAPDRIACDISANAGKNVENLTYCTKRLREIGFRISVSDYGSGDGDFERARLLRPDYVKFDGHWVRDYMHNPAGLALLKVVVRQFLEAGIEPLFERLEEMWQVDLCEEIGVPLMQGYALARPEIAPTSFNRQFPEMLTPAAALTGDVDDDKPGFDAMPASARDLATAKPSRVFGKRLG